MSSITRKIFYGNDITITSGTDYSTPIRMDGASAGCVVAPNGFGNASVSVEWCPNGPNDIPTNADDWYTVKDSENLDVAAYSVGSGVLDYIELPLTVFGKPWVRLKIGANAAADVTLKPIMVG